MRRGSAVRGAIVGAMLLGLVGCTADKPNEGPASPTEPAGAALVAALETLPAPDDDRFAEVTISDQAAIAQGAGLTLPTDASGDEAWRDAQRVPRPRISVLLPDLLMVPSPAGDALGRAKQIQSVRSGPDVTVIGLGTPDDPALPADGERLTQKVGRVPLTLGRRGPDVIATSDPAVLESWLAGSKPERSAASVSVLSQLSRALEASGAQSVSLASARGGSIPATHVGLATSVHDGRTRESVAVALESDDDVAAARTRFETYAAEGSFGFLGEDKFKDLVRDINVSVVDHVVIMEWTPKEVGKILREYRESTNCPTCG